jgi:hypothetical protein
MQPPTWAKGWLGEQPPKVVESSYAKPVRMVAVWSPAVLNSAGKKPTRGFGGRLYFYDAGNNAVPVEGQLVVYGYNDSKPATNGKAADGKTPDRKYAFTPEQFTQHFSPTDLGASYSVWIPWDEVGGPQVDVSLVPIFTAASGQLVVGQSSRNLLPGPTTENTPTKIEHFSLPPGVQPPLPGGAFPIQQAAYVEAPSPVPAQPVQNNLDELTIRVPSTLSERMASAGPQTIESRDARQAAPTAKENAPAATATGPAPGAGVIPPPWFPTNLPQARYARPTHPAPSGPGLRPAPGRLPSQPYLATPPSYPQALPPAAPPTPGRATW